MRLVVALVSCLLTGCFRFAPCKEGRTPLMWGIPSQISPATAKSYFQAAGRWSINKRPGPTDRRPRFDFLFIDVGDVVHLGQTGRLGLVFYNDRLYSMMFTPDDVR